MKLRIDGGLCTGHGRCYSIAPDVYEPDDEGFSDNRDVEREVRQGQEEAARLGASSCPEAAIVLSED
ncbi:MULTISPECIES: ferredoxin [Rhodococcus]|jgi:ferredoxin|uniref:Ferredoxin n=1 Tax=Rhodococcus oxybenzonivorans TaxID=1990687 RepID=A0AAE4V3B7_9NOCA|nr:MULTISPECIES: ferredoxin [Rhodococcus]MDV7245273.1 ferredoxin [Rhodococcus oxybenzonivorans]MDV7267048.1 ferredoxin [Rhodococcus oxybenzonivorans]MDV7272447.1 ferredoxin [Rhodococcus oxybenzonivorans]MDV7336298.1 ferredoxin [Rhodococcus oxybenzonivorans]MDV7342983.1 ferredoxin [Rhodococcus oxybenzonivorans]